MFTISYLAVWNLHWTILKTVPQTPLSYPMMKEYLAVRQLSGDKDWPSFLDQRARNDFEKRYDYYKHNASTDTFLHGTIKISMINRDEYEELKSFWMKKMLEHPKEYFIQKCDSFHRQMRHYKIYGEMFNPWHLFWLEAILCAISLLTALRRPDIRMESLTVFFTAASGLMYVSSYFVFAFVWDFRYLSWFLYAGMIAPCLFPVLRNGRTRYCSGN